MSLIKTIRTITVIISACCLLAFSAHSFPKKKHAIVKEKIDREAYAHMQTFGYYYGVIMWCNYQSAKDKNFQKRIKGVVAYTNWDLFLVFNNGINDVESALYVAGVGYTSPYDSFQQQPIPWKNGITGCDTNSLKLAYSKIDEVIPSLINFLLERDNYQDNLNSLLVALQKDKKDDYGSAIQKLKSVSETYGTSGSTIAIDNSSDEETSTTNVSIEPNNSGEMKTVRKQLQDLKDLYDDGLISEDDYNAKKQEILDNL